MISFLEQLSLWAESLATQNVNTPYMGQTKEVVNCIIGLSSEIKKTYPFYSNELFRAKDNLFHIEQGFTYIKIGVFGGILMIIRSIKYDLQNPDSSNFWSFIHPKILDVSQQKFIDGHFADAVESAFKEINDRIKKIHLSISGKENDGSSLMKEVFSPKNPVLVFEDMSLESGKNVQTGFMEMFSGAMIGIRNPNAHANLTMSREDAVRKLIFTSMLMYKVDEALVFTGHIQ